MRRTLRGRSSVHLVVGVLLVGSKGRIINLGVELSIDRQSVASFFALAVLTFAAGLLVGHGVVAIIEPIKIKGRNHRLPCPR